MNTSTSKILAALPKICGDFYAKNTPFIHQIIRLNLSSSDDILSDIYVLYAEHRLTLPELSKIYNVRKINNVWHAVDPLGHAQSLAVLESQGFDVVDEREEYVEEPRPELPVCVITSTREFSDKLHITMRRAQQIYKAQIQDLAAGNDLFGMGV
ncbi:hypothetical protein [Sulfuriferula nivalis]|uniref:Uncharacterized protein n=1 Tax=Sulfuriferula nivalis TaxID=2675298 RepID=A0A809RFE7_9PROT|nr:hypothetical protein [Sulfuriferula nivalis]BBP00366.1 hypothetical protein SFSGTM_10740 [Sulfuriferula nivalis]